MIGKPQLTKSPVKMNLRQYSASPEVKEASKGKQMEMKHVSIVLVPILRLYFGNKENGITFSVYAHMGIYVNYS